MAAGNTAACSEMPSRPGWVEALHRARLASLLLGCDLLWNYCGIINQSRRGSRDVLDRVIVGHYLGYCNCVCIYTECTVSEQLGNVRPNSPNFIGIADFALGGIS